MSEATKEVKYLVCDGCGYVISPTKPYMILTVKREREKDQDLHFHMPRDRDKGEKRTWGTSDCLGYWHVNRKARELSSGTDGVNGLAYQRALRERDEAQVKK